MIDWKHLIAAIRLLLQALDDCANAERYPKRATSPPVSSSP